MASSIPQPVVPSSGTRSTCPTCCRTPSSSTTATDAGSSRPRARAIPRASAARPTGAAGAGHPQRHHAGQPAARRRRRGVGDHRLRRHDAHGAGARRAGHPAVARPRPEDIFAVAADFLPGYGAVRRSSAARRNCWPTCWPGAWRRPSSSPPWRTRQFPDNAYITGWAEPAWALLDQLERVGMDRAAERLAGYALAPVSRGRSRRHPLTTSCVSDASGCWAARSSRSATRGRCTWSAAPGRGCTTPTATRSSMPTTTCRWSATPTRA